MPTAPLAGNCAPFQSALPVRGAIAMAGDEVRISGFNPRSL